MQKIKCLINGDLYVVIKDGYEITVKKNNQLICCTWDLNRALVEYEKKSCKVYVAVNKAIAEVIENKRVGKRELAKKWKESNDYKGLQSLKEKLKEEGWLKTF